MPLKAHLITLILSLSRRNALSSYSRSGWRTHSRMQELTHPSHNRKHNAYEALWIPLVL